MIKENSRFKTINTRDFNMFFNKHSGTTITYGKTMEEDPEFCPMGPIIADFEVSTICSHNCAFCYKSNTSDGNNMSFELFKDIFHKLPRTITQIAFGIGDISSNPDLKKIMQYCRNNDYQYVVPNVTINGAGMTKEWYDFLTDTCGAIAVSYYDKDTCFNVVKELSDYHFKQVNIHALLSEETYDECLELINLVNSDKRLKRLYAVIFLMLKQKGRGISLNRITDDRYNKFVGTLLSSGINFGFDSCGAGRLLTYLKDKDNIFRESIEPCESGLFSMYVNSKGRFFPCSFAEGLPEWEEGIDLIKVDNFLKDVWLSEKLEHWRHQLLDNNRNCPNYKI